MRVFHDEEHFVGAFFFDLMTGVVSLSLFRLDPSSITTENESRDGSIIHDLCISYTIPVTATFFLFFSEDDTASMIFKLIFFRKKWRKF